MISRHSFRSVTLYTLLLILILLLSSCGSGEPEAVVDIEPPTVNVEEQGENPGAIAPEGEGVTFEEAELPEDFPASFPIPEGARIGSNLGMGGEDEFRVFISLTTSLEDSLAYYHTELPAKDWTIIEEEITSRGTEIAITSDDYSGELLFVAAEMGVALDVHLFPLGEGEDLPDLPAGFGDSGTLGDTVSSFPSDFPVPSSYTAIELNETLRAEGYELAFTYVGITEMGMIDFNIALMSVGWEIGEPSLEGVSGVYIVPFEDLASGFTGYAYITGNPGQFNMDTGGAVLIALAPGQP